jgi:hypothetical protein
LKPPVWLPVTLEPTNSILEVWELISSGTESLGTSREVESLGLVEVAAGVEVSALGGETFAPATSSAGFWQPAMISSVRTVKQDTAVVRRQDVFMVKLQSKDRPRFVSRQNLLLYSRRGKTRCHRPDDACWLGLR